jgi:membrane-associated phospholipid phosphatase
VKFIAVFLLITLSFRAFAQSDSSTSSHTALLIGSGVAVTSLLIASDQSIYDGVQSARANSEIIRSFGPAATTLGDGFFVTALFAGFTAYGAWQHDETAHMVGIVGLESFLLSGAITQVLKFSFGRERPYLATQAGGYWRGPSLPGDGNFSFPSGHTTSAFAAAAVISEYYRTKWVPYLVYPLAVCVGISRIVEQQHWASDTFVGGIIGYYSARLVIRWNKEGSTFSVLPVASPNFYGISLTYRVE